jgi:hypothetical protein
MKIDMKKVSLFFAGLAGSIAIMSIFWDNLKGREEEEDAEEEKENE